jgi:hypothetical protein
MKTQIIPQRVYEKNPEMNIDGGVIFDGDGDGVSAAAIWVMQNPGKYVAITNNRKSNRQLVKEARRVIPPEYFTDRFRAKRFAVLDISAEQNEEDLEGMLNAGAKIDFIDHHTNQDMRLLEFMSNFSKPDSREISTASLAYDAFGINFIYAQRIKAAQLAVVGLSNDGKGRAAQKLFEKDIPEEDMKSLLHYGPVLNYAASLGNTLDYGVVLSGFVDSQKVLDYLKNSDVNKVAQEMESSLAGLNSRINQIGTRQAQVYLFPSGTEKDVVLGLAAYSNYLNAKAAEIPKEYHMGILRTDDGKTRFAVRGPEALKFAESLAGNYGSKALGRYTAAGFDTTQRVNESDLIYRLNTGE